MALGIAIGSLVIALASLGWSIREGRRNADAVAREEDRRDEEIALVRSQLERQAQGQRDDQAAVLVGRSTGCSGHARGVDFPTSVRNVGRFIARDVAVWLALGGPDVDAAAAHEICARHNLGAVVPGDPEAKFALTQLAPFPGGKVDRDGLIVASWTDGNGPHIAVIGKLTVFV